MNLTDTNKVTYTPGHSPNATDFMSRRGLDSHGAFFLPHLQSGKSVLDCGCGPGTITMDIALRARPAEVIGIDFASSQVDVAKASAAQRGISNVRFVSGDVYALPFDSDLFDRVFSHALMEHLANPLAAMRELYRVVKPGGVAGVCSPDWKGFLIAPTTDSLVQAVRAYSNLQTQNGGDPNVGSKLGELLGKAGLGIVAWKRDTRFIQTVKTLATTLPCNSNMLAIRSHLQHFEVGARGQVECLRKAGCRALQRSPTEQRRE